MLRPDGVPGVPFDFNVLVQASWVFVLTPNLKRHIIILQKSLNLFRLVQYSQFEKHGNRSVIFAEFTHIRCTLHI